MPAAHVHLDLSMGETKRSVATNNTANAAMLPQRDQLNGALYGMGTGVWCESCSAKGPASKPLQTIFRDSVAVDGMHTHKLKSYVEGAVLPFAGLRGPSAAGWTWTIGADCTPSYNRSMNTVGGRFRGAHLLKHRHAIVKIKRCEEVRVTLFSRSGRPGPRNFFEGRVELPAQD